MSDYLFNEEEDIEIEYYYDMRFLNGKHASKVYDGLEPNFKQALEKYELKTGRFEIYQDEDKMVIIEAGDQTIPDNFFQYVAEKYKVRFSLISNRYINGEGGVFDESFFKPGSWTEEGDLFEKILTNNEN